VRTRISVLDGSLEVKYTHEKELLTFNKIVCGLSKTTNLLTQAGNSVSAYLDNSTDKKTWYYKVNSVLYFVRTFVNLTSPFEYFGTLLNDS